MSAELIAGRYRLDELLGRTGMSEVWAAHDAELRRRVAIKLLAPDADRARFEREARAAATLSHPNITQIYDYGEAGGRPYMVLEYLPGGTLEDRLAGGKPLPDATTDRISRDLAAGRAVWRRRAGPAGRTRDPGAREGSARAPARRRRASRRAWWAGNHLDAPRRRADAGLAELSSCAPAAAAARARRPAARAHP